MEVLAAEIARIEVLNPDLASKIAAGEVVERPASVVKELLENSLDANATQIDLYIEGGGIQSIEVRDNGCGILQEDLNLALQQHATSKIKTAQDLAQINSLGFRGEALASICSVAKLSIIAQTSTQEYAWCLAANKLSPAARPIGTTVLVQDLFYNLPARRKFLRSERTEYQHIEEIFRRLALSNFKVGFSLTNNHKIVKKLPPCTNNDAQIKRLQKLCGQEVLKDCLVIDAEQNGLRLWGWLATPQQARTQEQHQYFFINQRVIRDRLINHAIRSVYQPFCQDGKLPFYCLYLELDPIALDVNVHPTKHEVRFRDPRIIHAFLTDTLQAALGKTLSSEQEKNYPMDYKAYNFKTNNTFDYAANQQTNYKILSILQNKILLAQKEDSLIILDLVQSQREILVQQLKLNQQSKELYTAQIINTVETIDLTTEFLDWCLQLGFVIQQSGVKSAILRAVPDVIHTQKIDLTRLLETLESLYHRPLDKLNCYFEIIACVDFSMPVNQQQIYEILNQTPLHKNYIRECKPEQLLEIF